MIIAARAPKVGGATTFFPLERDDFPGFDNEEPPETLRVLFLGPGVGVF